MKTIAPPSDQSSEALTRRELRARFFRGICDPVRLEILELLLKGEHSVGEIVTTLGIAQSRVSNHLACLRWCGFVTTRKDGRSVYYSIADPSVAEIIALADAVIAKNAEYILSCTRL